MVSKSVIEEETIPKPLKLQALFTLYEKLVAPNLVSISLALLFLAKAIPKSLEDTLKLEPPLADNPRNPPVNLK